MKFLMTTFIALSLFLSINLHATAQSQPNNTATENHEMDGQYAMVFFFRSDCQYCHRFAPKLKAFSQQNNLYTYAFTLDGKAIRDYPAPIPSTPEIAEQFFENPRSITVPATFLINVNTRKYARVSIGDVSRYSLQETYDNIMNDKLILESLQ